MKFFIKCFFVFLVILTSDVLKATPQFDENDFQRRFSSQKGLSVFLKPTRRIVVFGDSLSDSEGRTSKYTNGIVPLSILYWRGRATNGPVWVEYLSAALSVPVVSYAYSGARLEKYNDYGLFPQALRQLWAPPIGYAIAEADRDGMRFDAQDLVILWIGSNDFSFEPKPQDGTDYVEKTLAVVHALMERGAQRLVVMGVPDVSTMPFSLDGGSLIPIAELSHLVWEHNTRLRDAVIDLQKKHRNFDIDYVTLSSMLNNLLTKPGDYGLKNTRNACLTGSNWPLIKIPFPPIPPLVLANFLGACPHYNDHLFWDSWHPNTAVHCLASVEALSQLARLGRVKSFTEESHRASCTRL